MSSNETLNDYDFGYDPTIDEPIDITPLEPVVTLPSSASVNPKYLPPVGKQSTPNCAAWATSYGLATFTAAQAGDYPPTDTTLQASPAYIYIQVMKEDGIPEDTCRGSQFISYFNILKNGGTPTMSQAPYDPPCATLWSDYGSQSLTPDPAFTLSNATAVSSKVVDQVKNVLVLGKPLVYGTSLYTDFPKYDGNPRPYVGNGVIMMNKKTSPPRPVGHCMLIIGYNDIIGTGAFYIQNSFGTDWGNEGYIWIQYDTFTELAQGKAFYVKE